MARRLATSGLHYCIWFWYITISEFENLVCLFFTGLSLPLVSSGTIKGSPIHVLSIKSHVWRQYILPWPVLFFFSFPFTSLKNEMPQNLLSRPFWGSTCIYFSVVFDCPLRQMNSTIQWEVRPREGLLGPCPPAGNSLSLIDLYAHKIQGCWYRRRVSLKLWFVTKCICRLLFSLGSSSSGFIPIFPVPFLASPIGLTLLHPWERRFDAAQTSMGQCVFNLPNLQETPGEHIHRVHSWVLCLNQWIRISGYKACGLVSKAFPGLLRQPASCCVWGPIHYNKGTRHKPPSPRKKKWYPH